MDSSFAQAIRDSTRLPQAEVPNPQSLPTIMFSLPTTDA